MAAPCFMLFFGYWMLSSKQLISNEYLEGRVYANDAFKSQHVMGSIFHKEGWEAPAWPVLLMAFVGLLISLLHRPLNVLFNKLFPFWEIGDVDPNEEIGDYWESLDSNDLAWSYHEEKRFRNLFRIYGKTFKMLDDVSFDSLSKEYHRRQRIEKMNDEKHQDASYEPKSPLQGTHSYDILANPNYFDDFIYIPVY